MPDTSMPMKIMLTGIQTLISFQLSLSTETAPQRANRPTTRELIKFCKIKEKEINLPIGNSVKYRSTHTTNEDHSQYRCH